MYVCIYIYIYIHTYIHTYIQVRVDDGAQEEGPQLHLRDNELRSKTISARHVVPETVAGEVLSETSGLFWVIIQKLWFDSLVTYIPLTQNPNIEYARGNCFLVKSPDLCPVVQNPLA